MASPFTAKRVQVPGLLSDEGLAVRLKDLQGANKTTQQTEPPPNSAVDMANNSKYGLQAGVFSNDQKNIERAVERLEYGGIIINDAPIFRVDNMPYGGMKESGFGREGVGYAMEEMSEIKLVVYEK